MTPFRGARTTATGGSRTGPTLQEGSVFRKNNKKQKPNGAGGHSWDSKCQRRGVARPFECAPNVHHDVFAWTVSTSEKYTRSTVVIFRVHFSRLMVFKTTIFWWLTGTTGSCMWKKSTIKFTNYYQLTKYHMDTTKLLFLHRAITFFVQYNPSKWPTLVPKLLLSSYWITILGG